MAGTIRKKTYNLDEELIKKARRAFGAKTDTEAIQAALRMAVEEKEIRDALEKLLRKGKFRLVYR